MLAADNLATGELPNKRTLLRMNYAVVGLYSDSFPPRAWWVPCCARRDVRAGARSSASGATTHVAAVEIDVRPRTVDQLTACNGSEIAREEMRVIDYSDRNSAARHCSKGCDRAQCRLTWSASASPLAAKLRQVDMRRLAAD